MSHNNFCILPFIHLATNTNGTARLCCKSNTHMPVTDSNGSAYTIDNTSLNDIFYSDYMNNVRQRILNDEKLPECSVCFNEEDLYYDNQSNKYPSKRRRENQKWLHKPDTKLTYDFEELVNNPKIRYYDIRMGNLCNLKCRMCWPHFSSQIQKENETFKKLNQTVWHKSVNFENIWENTELFWKSIQDNILDLEEITFVGGEPTLHDGMYDLIYELVSRGISKNVRLKITTNMTNIQPRFLESLQHFKKVIIDVSMDGIGPVQEYIRYPSDWKTIENNIDSLLDLNLPNTVINISPVIQLYNIFDLKNIIDWYIDKLVDGDKLRNIQLMLNQLYEPNYLSFELLNASAREQWYNEIFVPCNQVINRVIKNIENYDVNCRWRWRELEETRKRIVGIAKRLHLVYLKKDSGNEIHNAKLPYEKFSYNKEMSEQCIAYTKQLDIHRKQSVYDIIPKFNEMINDEKK